MIEIKHCRLHTLLHTVEAEDLEGIDLRGLDLRGADFRDAELQRANLNGANLEGANFSGADLSFANLTSANLSFADLPDAHLREAILIGVDLSNADLRSANLVETCLWRARIIETNLTGALVAGASMMDTLIARCPTLSDAQELDDVEHLGASSIDSDTLRACIHRLPAGFLRGLGFTNDVIDTLRSIFGQAIYFSCFISYARSDDKFAHRLHNDLEGANVPCWLDVNDLRGGDYWRGQINEAIRLRDKTVLVCSEASLQRVNVVEEILATIADERRTGKQKLFPITIDHAVYDPAFQQRVAAALPRQQQREDWLTYVGDYHIPDFSGWKEHDAYQRAFGKLLRDLRAAAVVPE